MGLGWGFGYAVGRWQRWRALRLLRKPPRVAWVVWSRRTELVPQLVYARTEQGALGAANRIAARGFAGPPYRPVPQYTDAHRASPHEREQLGAPEEEL